MRYKLLRWLRDKVFRVPEGVIAPKPLMFIYHVLFPTRFIIDNQSHLKYDPLTDTFIIKGLRFSSYVFDMLKDEANKGSVVQLVETGQYVTMRRLDTVQDRINALDQQWQQIKKDNPLIELSSRLMEAVKNENYEEAARLRDLINSKQSSEPLR